MVAACVGIAAITTALAADRAQTKRSGHDADRSVGEVEPVAVTDVDTTIPVLTPVPANAVFKPAFAGAQPTEGRTAAAVSKLVYSNTEGRLIFGPSARQRVSDDVTTIADNGCTLDKFVFRVSGDEDQNPLIDEGPFTVDYALYTACPGAKICQPWNTNCPPKVTGTTGSITLPDEGFHEVTVTIPPLVCAGGMNDGQACFSAVDCLPTCIGGSAEGSPCQSFADCPGGVCDISQVGICTDTVKLPPSFFLGLSFSREQAGVVVGAPALVGVSSDRYDGPSPCSSAFGGFPAHPHASFHAEFYVKGTCRDSFPAYRNTMQAGPAYSAGADRLFADDVNLSVDAADCNMIGYEVAFKGARSSSQGAVQVALHASLSNSDPENGGRILGTRMQGQVWDTDVRIFRKVFPDAIPLADYIQPGGRVLHAVFKTKADTVGPIKTCKDGNPGHTLDLIQVFQPGNPDGSWVPVDFGGSCHSGVEVTIFCEGPAPTGACCDLLVQEAPTCVGGTFPDVPCGRNEDCTCLPACVDGTCDTAVTFTCLDGDRKGAFCNNDTDCACPSNTCSGNVCDGGRNHNLPCITAADCGFPQPCISDGACVGEAVCREVPEMNCATTDPTRWVRDGRCGPVCVGGGNHGLSCGNDNDCPSVCVDGPMDGQPCPAEPAECTAPGSCYTGTCEGSFCTGGIHDGQACTRQADCEGGECTGQPFINRQACGSGSCCGCIGGTCADRPTDCIDSTERECVIATPEGGRLFRAGELCATTRCPFGACLSREGDCTLPRRTICVGGMNDGLDCDPNEFGCTECPGLDPQQPRVDCGTCPGIPGCGDPFCCSAVCANDDFCCTVWWDPQCASLAASAPECRFTEVANDLCHNSEDPDKGALLVELPLFLGETDVINSLTSPEEPGFCCNTDDPGGQGEGATWFKFVAEHPTDPNATTVSVGISTCASTGRSVGDEDFPADDSLLQVFSVADPDLGACRDLSPCSTSAQDCVDGSKCIVADGRGCINLIPIACNDDFGAGCPGGCPGCAPQTENSTVCIPDAIVGHTYYFMVAAKPSVRSHCVGGSDDGVQCISSDECGGKCEGGTNTRDACTDPPALDCPDPKCEGGLNNLQPCASDADCPAGTGGGGAGQCVCCPGGSCVEGICTPEQHRGVYRVTVSTPCSGGIPGIPNDLCDDADVLTGAFESVPFDLSGGGIYDPVSFDCPGPDPTNCVSTLKNDIWYDWIAPANGKVTIDTCAGSGLDTENTSMAVYEGCDCPPDDANIIDCSDFETSSGCFTGSKVRFNAVKDACYKVRLGGHGGLTDIAGTLNINLEQCPDGVVSFDDPASDIVDARQPHPPTDTATGQGLQSFRVTAPPGANVVDVPGSAGRFTCWSLCETALDAGFTANRITGVADNFDGTYRVTLARPITTGAVTTLTFLHGDGSETVGVFTSHPGNADGGPMAEVTDVTAVIDYISGAAAPPPEAYSQDIDQSGLATSADILRLIDVLQGAHAFDAWMDTPLPQCAPICCSPAP